MYRGDAIEDFLIYSEVLHFTFRLTKNGFAGMNHSFTGMTEKKRKKKGTLSQL